MDQSAITLYISTTFAGVDVVVASRESGAPEMSWGDAFFFCEGDHRFPFATIVTKDYPGFDAASNLNRAGVFRLNIGVGKETFQALFGQERAHDFAALNTILPHPVYGRQYWVCVLNPSEATFEAAKPLLGEAYELARKRNPKAGGE
jgi:hypothetical protein